MTQANIFTNEFCTRTEESNLADLDCTARHLLSEALFTQHAFSATWKSAYHCTVAHFTIDGDAACLTISIDKELENRARKEENERPDTPVQAKFWSDFSSVLEKGADSLGDDGFTHSLSFFDLDCGITRKFSLKDRRIDMLFLFVELLDAYFGAS